MESTNAVYSICITTYRRPEFLKRAVQSALNQSYPHFEVLIGNDDVAGPLELKALGISDPRVRLINHQTNLKEIGNMNRLLELCTGEYFTIMSDDDFCHPDFLLAAEQARKEIPGAQVTFTSFDVVREGGDKIYQSEPEKITGAIRSYTGPQFAAEVLNERILAIGVCGLYSVPLLKSWGGIEELIPGSAIGLYSEYLVLAKCANLLEIAYVDLPLTIYFSHSASWGISNLELEKYKKGGPMLVKRSAEIFVRAQMPQDLLNDAIFGVTKMVSYKFLNKFITGNKSVSFSRYWIFYGSQVAALAKLSFRNWIFISLKLCRYFLNEFLRLRRQKKISYL